MGGKLRPPGVEELIRSREGRLTEGPALGGEALWIDPEALEGAGLRDGAQGRIPHFAATRLPARTVRSS